jgi:hypothetical protein
VLALLNYHCSATFAVSGGISQEGMALVPANQRPVAFRISWRRVTHLNLGLRAVKERFLVIPRTRPQLSAKVPFETMFSAARNFAASLGVNQGGLFHVLFNDDPLGVNAGDDLAGACHLVRLSVRGGDGGVERAVSEEAHSGVFQQRLWGGFRRTRH